MPRGIGIMEKGTGNLGSAVEILSGSLLELVR